MLSVLGPGLIAALADNDASGISTYTVLGSHYGYGFLWLVLLVTFILAITQEMGARLGMVTGKGLAGLIREHFGVKLTMLAMGCLLVANFGTLLANYAGIKASFEIMGLGQYVYVAVPMVAFLVWLILFKGSFKVAEKIFLLFSAFFILYVVAGFASGPDWGEIGKSFVQPTFSFDKTFLLIFLAMIGTTITPWGQFFIQSYVVDKGLSVKDYKYGKIEVYLSAFLSKVIGFFIIVAAANTLFRNGIHIDDVQGAAAALAPIAGNFAPYLFAFGLLAASILGAFILPVTTAYALSDSMGWESGFDHEWKEAPWFYSIIAGMIFLTAGFVLLSTIAPLKIIIVTQAINAILLIVILVYLMKLMNNKKLLGKYVNKPLYNVAAWLTVFVLIASTVLFFGISWWGGGGVAL